MCRESQQVNFFSLEFSKEKMKNCTWASFWEPAYRHTPRPALPSAVPGTAVCTVTPINTAFRTKVSVCTMIQNENQCTDVTGRIHRLKEQGRPGILKSSILMKTQRKLLNLDAFTLFRLNVKYCIKINVKS